MKTFTEYIQMALKYMRRCSASHTIEEMKIKIAGEVSHCGKYMKLEHIS